MINVSDAAKDFFSRDVLASEFKFYIDNDMYDSSHIKSGSLGIVESLFNGEDIDFLSVNKSELNVTLGNLNQSIKELLGKQITFTETIKTNVGGSDVSDSADVDGKKLILKSPMKAKLELVSTLDNKYTLSISGQSTEYVTTPSVSNSTVVFTSEEVTETIPLGVYTIVESINDGDYMISIKAYDNLHLFDIDVSEWWNDLVSFPISIRNLLVSLCNYCNVPHTYLNDENEEVDTIPSDFTNSSYMLNETIELSNVSGLEMLGFIQQATASFIKADKTGLIKMVTIPTSNPVITYDTSKIINVEIADYEIEQLTGVNVRSTEDDIGVSVGTNDNVYIIQANPLFYNFTGESQAELQVVQNIYNAIKDIVYIPLDGEFKSAHYIECGDMIKVHTFKGNIVEAPLFYRELSGVGLIRDKFEIKGQQYHENIQTVDSSIRVLNRRSHEFSLTVEELRSDIYGVVSLTGFTEYYYLSTSEIQIEDTYLYFGNNTKFGEKTFFRIPWGGNWTTTMPEPMAGHYLWTKIRKVWSNGDITMSDPVLEDLFNRNYAYTIETKSSLQQTNELLKLKVNYDEYNINNDNIDSRFSAITQTADDIQLQVSRKVGEDEIISKINQSAEGIKINANKINLRGDVYISSSDSNLINNNVRINKGIITTYDNYGQRGIRLYGQRAEFYSWNTETENDLVGTLTVAESISGDSVNKSLVLVGDNGWNVGIGMSSTNGIAYSVYSNGATGRLRLNNVEKTEDDISNSVYLDGTNGTLLYVEETLRLWVSSTDISLYDNNSIKRLSITPTETKIVGDSNQYIRLRSSDGLMIANDDASDYIWLTNDGRIQIKTNGTAAKLGWYTADGRMYLVAVTS